MKSIKQLVVDFGLVEKPEGKPKGKLKRVEPIREYDEKGNLIHYKDSTGYEYWSEFDEKGNLIHYRTYSDGYEQWREYDEQGKRTGALINYRNGEWELNGREMVKKSKRGEVNEEY